MHQAGLHVPIEAGGRLPVFRDVFADIGDEQSVAQSLSTFSGHLRSIIRIVEAAGTGTLVLLDELGAGTDPTEGSALAQALLDYFIRAGALVAATTHYAELKAYAHTTAAGPERLGRVRPRDAQPDLPPDDRAARRQPGLRDRRAARPARRRSSPTPAHACPSRSSSFEATLASIRAGRGRDERPPRAGPPGRGAGRPRRCGRPRRSGGRPGASGTSCVRTTPRARPSASWPACTRRSRRPAGRSSARRSPPGPSTRRSPGPMPGWPRCPSRQPPASRAGRRPSRTPGSSATSPAAGRAAGRAGSPRSNGAAGGRRSRRARCGSMVDVGRPRARRAGAAAPSRPRRRSPRSGRPVRPARTRSSGRADSAAPPGRDSRQAATASRPDDRPPARPDPDGGLVARPARGPGRRGARAARTLPRRCLAGRPRPGHDHPRRSAPGRFATRSAGRPASIRWSLRPARRAGRGWRRGDPDQPLSGS